MTTRQRVVVITGGGGGIGAAIAETVSRTGAFVVTVDPLVTVDGSERLPGPEQTTAGRIVAIGGTARASGVSVTDASAIRRLFAELADEFGGLDAVVNVAGISRPTGFATGSAEDWLGVLAVHLDGYRNVLGAALPLMAAAGRGHILGVTSGSGWRLADAGAYGCAKRAVAELTWQLGRHAPEGVVVNAISPIAATRMVAAALGRAQSGGATGGLSLGSMPAPEHLGPLGAHLVDATFDACQGRVLFAGGSEVAVIDEPRLVEVVRSDGVPSVAHVLAAATGIALAPAEAAQVSGGGSNGRFGSVFDETPAGAPDGNISSLAYSCAVVADEAEAAQAVTAALHARGVTCHACESPSALAEFGAVDAVVVVAADRSAAPGATGWERILAEHDGIVEQIHSDAQWSRAVADLAAATGRPIRLVTITEAVSSGGRSRAQAAAQLSRAGRRATGDQVVPFAISAESDRAEFDPISAEFAAHLVCDAGVEGLSGAELVTGTGWFGLRSHPRPIGSISFGGPAIPQWFDAALTEVVHA